MLPADMPEHIRKMLGVPDPAPPSPEAAAVCAATDGLNRLTPLLMAAGVAPALAPYLYAECETACLRAAALFREAGRHAAQRDAVLTTHGPRR